MALREEINDRRRALQAKRQDILAQFQDQQRLLNEQIAACAHLDDNWAILDPDTLLAKLAEAGLTVQVKR